MPLRGRRQDIDMCVADLVAALNAAGVITTASCCGHNERHGRILLEDGRVLVVVSPESIERVERKDEVEILWGCAFHARDVPLAVGDSRPWTTCPQCHISYRPADGEHVCPVSQKLK